MKKTGAIPPSSSGLAGMGVSGSKTGTKRVPSASRQVKPPANTYKSKK